MSRRPPGFTALLLASLLASSAGAAETDTDLFENRIRPLLMDACIECHGAKKQKGDLRLDWRGGWEKGGASGRAIVPGKPDDSLLVTAVRYWDKDLQMPPKHALEAEEVNDLIEWVKRGAPDPRDAAPQVEAPPRAEDGIDLEKGRQHWAFQPVRKPEPPPVSSEAWPRNEVDRFTLHAMEKAGVQPAPDADRRTLLRRVTFDLIGLPPTPAEIESFEQDSSPDAFARVVERLLASPHYGERWGRHWLDVVRYADTCGNASDYPIPQAYKYRDYVLQAVNDDLPFDQFVREQIAGDLLPAASEPERQRRVVATGYLAMARHFAGGDGEPHLTLEDAIDNTGRAFLGLTMSCARCHDHKFDPISARDYYALYGIFSSTVFPHPGSEGKSRPANLVPLIDKAEAEAAEKARADEVAALDLEIKAAEEAKATAEKEPESAERKTKIEAAAKLAAEAREKQKRARETPPYPLAYAVSERAESSNARLHVRGDPKRLGEEVPRAFLQVLGGQAVPAEHKGSGRLDLAQWITDPANPLTARVMVNRIWQHHFGRGLVATPNDFGTRGLAPSHPELLDYLATRLVENGWSIKAMHRLLLLSRTWQLSSTVEDLNADPTNALWSRADRRRLDAESIRDTMLFVSGELDLTPSGEHPFPPVHTWGFTQHNQFFAVYDTPKRSVYQMQQRLRKHPFFALFDGADTNSSTASRAASTTPLQSLFGMNDKFTHTAAERLGARLMAAAPEDAARIEQAFLTLYGRPPEAEESAMFLQYFSQLREKKQLSEEQLYASFARVLLTANEFLFID
ncbi:MAG: PSD1 and planctomycete cytochrome C domain-containing protein [Chthoniobacteraceae bacterium]